MSLSVALLSGVLLSQASMANTIQEAQQDKEQALKEEYQTLAYLHKTAPHLHDIIVDVNEETRLQCDHISPAKHLFKDEAVLDLYRYVEHGGSMQGQQFEQKLLELSKQLCEQNKV